MEYIYLHNCEDYKVSALKSRDFVHLWPLFLKLCPASCEGSKKVEWEQKKRIYTNLYKLCMGSESLCTKIL
jgi:hypothetical protein